MPNSTSEKIKDERALTTDDLVTYLVFLDEHVSEDLHESFVKMLNAPAREERITIARRVLPEDNSGFAHLVLAIEVDDADQQKQHFIKALELSKQRNEDDSPFWFVLGHSSLHLATLQWEQNLREEAISVLEEALKFRYGQHLIDEIRYSLVSYLVILNQDERARAVLDKEGDPTFEWYYLNALLRFKQHGDTSVSRGALVKAIAEDDLVAYKISDTEFYLDEEDLEELDGWSKKYIAFTREAWKANPLAMEWLISSIQRVKPKVGLSEVFDDVRNRRIGNDVELAIKHSEREDFKNAKRSFNSALREANRLNDGGESFVVVGQLFSGFLNQLDEPQSPIIEIIKQRMSWIDGQAQNAEPEALLNSYMDVAGLAFEVGGFDEAELSAHKAYEIFRANHSEYNTQTGEIILAILGTAAAQRNDPNNLEKYTRERIAMAEETVGRNHLDMVEPLQVLRFALHTLGNHEEELEIAKHAYEIDPNADDDEDLEKLDWCEVE